MSSPVHLAVDLGASSGRVIAACIDNGKLSMRDVHRFANDPVRVQSSMQWNTLGLWSEIQTGLKHAAQQHNSIASVGVDTWGVDYVLLDEHDHVAGPVWHYRDERTRGIIDRVCKIVPRDEIFEATGLQFIELNTLNQLVAARLRNERALDIADGLLMMGDFFHWLLTGQRSVEATMASTTQLLDPRNKQWRTDLIEKFNLPQKLFGAITEPGTTLGPIQESVAGASGLAGVPVVIPATHDTASAVLAVPAEDFAPQHPSWCYISSGTWSLMGCELASPKINARCSELNFTNEGGVQGSTRLLKNIGGLWIFQQIRRSLESRGEAVSWDEMVTQAQTAEPFSLLLNPDAPEFNAPDDMMVAIAGYATRTQQRAPKNNATMYRAALEGLALRYRASLDMLESLLGNRIDVIHIVGGGSVNELLCQMTADACDRKVVAGPVEATAIGNVLMQMLGTGKLQSIDEARALVRTSFQTINYTPQNASTWKDPAKRFAEL